MFDYEKSKKKYIEELENKQGSMSKYLPYNQESKKGLVSFIKAKVSPYHTRYDTIKDKNDVLLILKRRLPDVPVVEVLPAMECFDVMAEAHLHEDHANGYQMTAILKSIYYIPSNVVNIFLKACNVCASRKQFGKYHVNKRLNKVKYIPEYTVYCTISWMYTNPDNRLSHVIVYVDTYTNYAILRPTYSKDNHVVAYELLKIFLDFGLPENILVLSGDEYYKTIMTILKSTDIFFKLPNVGIRKILPKLAQVTENTFSLLHSWISKYKSSNWAIGLKEIQWHLNTLLIGDSSGIKSRKLINTNIKSPYHAHFGFLPNDKVIQRNNKLPKVIPSNSSHTINKSITVDGYCLKCGEKVNNIYYKICVLCKQKCHFNCCVLNVLKLSTGDYTLEVTCISCEELKCVTIT